MGYSFKYIPILFLISYIIYLLTLPNNKKDGFKNYLEIDNDLNKKLIDEYERVQKDKELMKTNNKTIPKYLMDLHYNKDKPKTLKKEVKRIYKPLKMDLQSNDYPRYETILSKEYQVDQVKYTKDLPEVKDPGIEKPIDGKKDREKLFDATKSCKGEWSEWNTERCGEPSNHCALKSRKYKIISAEKPGGDSCKFKDGEMQYDYCYGRNHNERCGYSRNLCQCDLNKYDGDPSNCNMETDKNCRCPPGYTFNDVDVTNFVKNAGLLGKDKEDDTERDRIGYDPTFSLKKGSCRKNICFCDNGTESKGLSCKVDGDHTCELTPCNTGYILKGNPPRCYEAEKDETESRIIQPNCPYSKGESIIMGASTDDPENIALFSKQNKYLYCGNVETVCSEGYELNHSQKCKDFYKEFDFDLFNHNQGGPQTPPVSCCLPKPGQCKFSEIVGEGKPYRNIFDGDNDLQRLRSMNINQLRRINYNGTGADLSAQPEDPLGTNGEKGKCLDFTNSGNNDVLNNILINSGDSKASMVQYIYNNACDKPTTLGCISNPTKEDENKQLCRENSREVRRGNCFIQGSIDNCKNVFTCNNGYKFVPDDPTNKDLLVTECKQGEIPKFNGKCVANKCDIDPLIRERYNILRSIKECDTTLGVNCGIHNLSCRKEEYIDEVNEGSERIIPRLECDGNILTGYGCNNGQIPFSAEADNERYSLLTSEKEKIEEENKRLRKLKYTSEAKKRTYIEIDTLIKLPSNYIRINGNNNNIRPLDPDDSDEEIVPSIIHYIYNGDGSIGNTTITQESNYALFNDDGTLINDNDYKDYYNSAVNEYRSIYGSDPSASNIFQSQRLKMETLNIIRLDVRISRNDSAIAEIQDEIDRLDNTRPGN